MIPFTDFLLEFYTEDAKAAVKQMEKGGVKSASWTTERDGRNREIKVAVVTMHDDEVFHIVPFSTTTYKKMAQSRLRNAGGTRKEVYLDIRPPKGVARMGKSFSTATGEGSLQDEKVAKGKQKAMQWFQKNLGLPLKEFDFNY